MRALALITIMGSGGCGDTPVTPATPLASDGTHLRDADGRIALLRGVNARIGGVFDVQFADGRTALEPIPALAAADCQRMRTLGIDFLRLPINWSALEPTAGAFDDTYLDRVEVAVRCAGDAGLVVMIDFHQDAYSKEIGEDGAPLWAIQPAPTMLLQGPLTDLGARRLSGQVDAAFRSFFDPADAAGLQAAFDDALEHVATRFADDDAVIGFELFNEPPVKESDVDAFHATAAARVHAAAPKKLVMFEPSATRNLLDNAPRAAAPFPVANAVYAPHIYTFVFSDAMSLMNLQPSDLEPSVASARDEATAWHTPLLIGEFGVGPTTPNADLWMGVEAELHDRYLASDAFWVWKENSQGAWGIYDHADATGAWTERPQVVAWISRVHAARIAGDVVDNAYNHTTGALRLEVASGTTHGHPTEIYIPERAATTFTVTCDGASVTAPRDGATGLISVTCDGVIAASP